MNVTELVSHFSRHIGRINDISVTQLCGLTIGTTTTKLKTTYPIVFFIGNEQIELSPVDGITMTACAQQAAGTFCYYVLAVNKSSSYLVLKGTDDTYALPSVTAGYVPIGAFKITTVGVTFTSGTTALDAAGVTDEYFDMDTGIALTILNQTMRSIETMYDLRCMRIRTTATLTATVAYFTNPITNYKKLSSVYATYNSTKYDITKVDIGFLENQYQLDQGPPQYLAEYPYDETSLTPDVSPTLRMMVGPIPDVAYVLTLTGYQYTPFMDNVIYQTNWWTQNAWDILTYESLVAGEAFYKNDDRIGIWKNMSRLKELVLSEREESFSGSKQYPRMRNVI